MASQVRLYAILARKAPRAVIFRRGPSDRVLLIGWNTETDTFEIGQWLHGRIYERRCDLSPEGDLLIYFAANYRPPLRSWTAISRPPFLTALALWPKGDGWGGGGHFLSRSRVALNHRPNEMALREGSCIPNWLKVRAFGEYSGRGEDDPIWSARLARDGWSLVDAGGQKENPYGATKVWFEFSPPIRFQKPNAVAKRSYSLEMRIHGIIEIGGPWYVVEHSVIRRDGVENIGRSEWADWAHTGDLLFSIDGSIYRLRYEKNQLAPLEQAEKVADFKDLGFEARVSPKEKQRWPRR